MAFPSWADQGLHFPEADPVVAFAAPDGWESWEKNGSLLVLSPDGGGVILELSTMEAKTGETTAAIKEAKTTIAEFKGLKYGACGEARSHHLDVPIFSVEGSDTKDKVTFVQFVRKERQRQVHDYPDSGSGKSQDRQWGSPRWRSPGWKQGGDRLEPAKTAGRSAQAPVKRKFSGEPRRNSKERRVLRHAPIFIMVPSDTSLLLHFISTQDEPAFRELVRRYFDLVLLTALRHSNEDRPLADDITQIVFADLARQARTLPAGVLLGGWLHRHTCFVAGKAVRTEQRRRIRETTAATTMQTPQENSAPPPVSEMAAALDESLLALTEPDRQALVLRYLERRDLRSIGTSLGISEDTAQKRVSRALEKLRVLLEGRGLRAAGISSALAGLLAAPAVEAASASLIAEISRRSLTLAACSGGLRAGAGISAGAAGSWPGTWPGLSTVALSVALLVGVPAYWTGRQQGASFASAALPSEKPTLPGESSGRPRSTAPAASDAPNRTFLQATPELADRLIALTRFENGLEETMEEAKQLVRALNPSELPALNRQIGERPRDWRLRGPAAFVVLSEWARTDPVAAMAASQGEIPQARVLQHWMNKDRPAALAWLEQQVTGEGFSKRTTQLVRSAAGQLVAGGELPAALTLAGRLSQPANAADIFSDITRLADSPNQRDEVRQSIAKVTDPATREQALRGFVGSWANADREGARAWIEAQAPEGRDGLVGEYARTWMWVDAAASADWWVAHSTDLQAAIRGAMENWRPEQINDAGAWLQRQGLGPQADAGLVAFSHSALLQDPPAALSWAGQIAEPGLRGRTAGELFQTWIEHDRPAAETFLRSARLPADTIAQLTSKLSTQ